MCLDLGLHLDSKSLVESGFLSEEEYNVRSITFWGCFIFDRYLPFITDLMNRGWSTYMGRPTVIPTDLITVQRPALDVHKEAEVWRPHYNTNDHTSQNKPFPERPSHICTVFERICSITEILGSVMASLYALKMSDLIK
jgi:Fungal specific transcription factor domain